MIRLRRALLLGLLAALVMLVLALAGSPLVYDGRAEPAAISTSPTIGDQRSGSGDHLRPASSPEATPTLATAAGTGQAASTSDPATAPMTSPGTGRSPSS